MRHLSLDEQRHVVDHDGVRVARLGLGDQFGRALPDSRVHNTVQIGQGLGIGEDDGAERRTIETAIWADDTGAETRLNRVESRRTRFDDLSREQIGVDVDGTALFEATCNGRFSGRDSAREPDEFHSPSVALRQSEAVYSCR